MDEVERLYSENKLLVRAMDQPTLREKKQVKYYECQTWVDEFDSLMKEGLDSLSTTLIIPNIGVMNYKNIGFLVNSDLADCFRINKSDSGSSGSIIKGDFQSNKSDFNKLSELANYIILHNNTTMNEVNVNIKLEAVVGLFVNKCMTFDRLLKKLYVVKKMLENITGIDYPIYSYDSLYGKIELVDLSKEMEEEIIDSLDTKEVCYWLEDSDEPNFMLIESNKLTK